MPVKNMWFNFRLEAIRVFLTRAFEVDDEYMQTFLRGCIGDFHGDTEFEHAGDILLAYEDIVIRAALGELNALVEIELKNLAESIDVEETKQAKKKRRIGRGTARRLIEDHYDVQFEDLPRFTEVDELRKIVNAYKHDDGLSDEYGTFLPHAYIQQRYQLEEEKAFQYLEAVKEFLLTLPGERLGYRRERTVRVNLVDFPR